MGKLKLSSFLATFLGIGFIPFAPGTFGSLTAMAIYILLPAGIFSGSSLPYYLAALLLFCYSSVVICTKAEKHLGHDASVIVIDEVCGYFVAVILLPKTVMIALGAFVLFRIFDIWKPFPISRSQDLKQGWGIVTDDLLAGLAANLLLHVAVRFFPAFWQMI